MLTEQQNPKTKALDTLDTGQILRLMNDEDKSVALTVERALPQIEEAVSSIVSSLRQNGRLLYVGAGTSGRLGVLDAVECVPTFGTPPSLVRGLIAGGETAFMTAVEGAEDKVDAGADDLKAINLQANDIVVGIAASGRTPYVLGALEYAKSIGVTTVGISCNEPAELLDVADIAIALPVGAEVVSGSTRLKAGTAQKMVLNMLSTASMVKLGKVYGNLMVDVQITNAKLQIRAERIVMKLTGLDEDSASTLLDQAEGSVKVAVVMHHENASRAEALQRLAETNGILREIIG